MADVTLTEAERRYAYEHFGEQRDTAERDAQVFDAEVGRTYLAIADLSEATLSQEHAVDIAEWVVGRKRWKRRRAARQAQALREYLARQARTAPIPDPSDEETP